MSTPMRERPWKRMLLATALLATALPAMADNAILRLRKFLDAHGRQDGLPRGAEAVAIAPHLSAALNAAIESARAEQAAFIRDNPGEKPPYIEGKLFTSVLFEPFTAYAPVMPAGGCPAPRCVIRVDFVDAASSPDVAWHDEYVLVLEDDRWRIDDVHFRGGFDFGNHGSLRASLPAPVAR